MLGMATETGLDVRTNRSFASAADPWESKWPRQVDLILPGLLSPVHFKDDRLHQTEEEAMAPPPLRTFPGVLDPSCLQLLRCQDEHMFEFKRMEIHHADLPEQSASACGHLCLRQSPDVLLVMAKLNPYNQHLVCGCGDQEALLSPDVLDVAPVCSQPCPDGGDSCGGPRAVSVYKVDRNKKECMVPSNYYYGCYHEKMGAGAFILDRWERWGGGCQTRCQTVNNSGSLMRLTTAANGTTACECGCQASRRSADRGNRGDRALSESAFGHRRGVHRSAQHHDEGCDAAELESKSKHSRFCPKRNVKHLGLA
ncbi:hypothetical protein E2C01_017687 [Portunus trituberculatus]|uniref:Uncharacterized protein n=1 Tax=Portunus trituberculatus TaxID=210409 RepID=A0A5B7DT65_PORTR|nr:hypothetical protein [Portunus trituberculatus]